MPEGELLDPLDEYNERMNRQADRDWNARHGRSRRTADEAQVVSHVNVPAVVESPKALVNPMESDPAEFRKALEVRTHNRRTLIQWVRDSLIRGTDFDKLHVVSRNKCSAGKDCKNPYHWSKDQLFKPGAEKICGMLGVTPSYPNLAAYEEAAIAGRDIRHVILRCQILSLDKRVLSEGVGARSLIEDAGVLNKALKMAAKSAHIDAVLKLGGLSEVFTHPDAPQGNTEAPEGRTIPAGKYEGKSWSEASEAYLRGVLASPKAPPAMKTGAQAELDRRTAQEGFDDDIPF